MLVLHIIAADRNVRVFPPTNSAIMELRCSAALLPTFISRLTVQQAGDVTVQIALSKFRYVVLSCTLAVIAKVSHTCTVVIETVALVLLTFMFFPKVSHVRTRVPLAVTCFTELLLTTHLSRLKFHPSMFHIATGADGMLFLNFLNIVTAGVSAQLWKRVLPDIPIALPSSVALSESVIFLYRVLFSRYTWRGERRYWMSKLSISKSHQKCWRNGF